MSTSKVVAPSCAHNDTDTRIVAAARALRASMLVADDTGRFDLASQARDFAFDAEQFTAWCELVAAVDGQPEGHVPAYELERRPLRARLSWPEGADTVTLYFDVSDRIVRCYPLRGGEHSWPAEADSGKWLAIGRVPGDTVPTDLAEWLLTIGDAQLEAIARAHHDGNPEADTFARELAAAIDKAVGTHVIPQFWEAESYLESDRPDVIERALEDGNLAAAAEREESDALTNGAFLRGTEDALRRMLATALESPEGLAPGVESRIRDLLAREDESDGSEVVR